MKQCKTAIVSLLLCVLCLAAGCADRTSAEDVKLTLSKTAVELVVGESCQLDVSVSPADAIDKKIEWKSSDESVVVVDGGMLTAKSAGEASISARTNGKEVSCTVTVTESKENG